MGQVDLSWEYKTDGPLPSVVEVYRDDIIIHTESAPITSYTDTPPSSMSSAEYFVRVKNGGYSVDTPKILVNMTNISLYSSFFPLSSDLKDVNSALVLNKTNTNPLIFGAYGLDCQNNAAYSQYTQSGYPYDWIMLLGSTSFTVECEIKTNAVATTAENIFGFMQSKNNGWAIKTTQNNTGFSFYIGSKRFDCPCNINDGLQHKLAVTFNGSEVKMFFDGVLLATHAASTAPSFSYGNLCIGYNYGTGAIFNGFVKNAGISNSILYG